MSWSDDVLNGLQKVLASLDSDADGKVLDDILELAFNPVSGGISGLIQRLNVAGLGKQIASWVSLGDNLPVTVEQVQGALDSDFIRKAAEKSGKTPEETSSIMARLMPLVIDQLTPYGRAPTNDPSSIAQMITKGLAALRPAPKPESTS